MPSITPMMSAILLELPEMSCIVATTWPITSPPRLAAWLAVEASWLAVRAVSAFWRMVALISSMEAAVCCRLDACDSVRWERSALPLAICEEPVAMESLAWRIWCTTRVRLPFMVCSDCSSRAASSRPLSSTVRVRSPSATAWATSTARAIGTVIERVIMTAPAMPARTATRATTPSTVADCTKVSWALAVACRISPSYCFTSWASSANSSPCDL